MGCFKGLFCRTGAVASLVMVSFAANADSFMGEKWAETVCERWNQTETLVADLSGDTWAANTSDKGHKVIQMYRDECGAQTRVELRIEDQEGKAMCTYGGAAQTTSLDEDSDYLMHATDEDWQCMGEGSFGCGAMGSMMSGKLKFSGPKMEAARVVEPFNAFLQLTGEVSGTEECPSQNVASGT